MVRNLVIPIPSYIYNQIKERCRFYDIPVQEVASSLLVRFLDGEFDKDFNIKPVDK